MKKILLVSGLLMVFAVALVLFLNAKHDKEMENVKFEITSIKGKAIAKAYFRWKEPEFDLPEKYFGLFDMFFDKPEKQKEGFLGEPLAEFRIELKNQPPKVLAVCFWGKGPIGFSLDKVPYLRAGGYQSTNGNEDGFVDESFVFCNLIGAVVSENKQFLNEELNLFRKSTGLPLPIK